MKVKVNWSGGKDSTAALLLYIVLGYDIEAVCYIPMLTKEIPLIEKAQYEFIMNAKKQFEAAGVVVHIVHGETYEEHVLKITKRRQNKGKIYGFPLPYACAFKRDSKIKALSEINKKIQFDIEDIGIAIDEPKRMGQLTGKKVSILVDYGWTENDAYNFCKNNNFLSPVYALKKRDGCAVCGNAKQEERERYFKDFPEAKEKLYKLEQICKLKRPERKPLRGQKWFFE